MHTMARAGEKLQLCVLSCMHRNAQELLLVEKGNRCVKQFNQSTALLRVIYSSDWDVFAAHSLQFGERQMLVILEGKPGTLGVSSLFTINYNYDNTLYFFFKLGI